MSTEAETLGNLVPALEELVKRCSEGGEFPDEAWRIAQKYGVHQKALEHAYDDYCSKGG